MSVILRLPGGGSGGGGEGGGPNGNSIILADNTTISTYSYDNKITVKWNPPPNTEMPIDHYVLYWKKTSTAPTSIDQYDDYVELSAGTREYSVTGLTNNDQYFFFLESVGTNEFGNASLRAQRTESVGIPMWVIFSANSYAVSEGSRVIVYTVFISYDLETFTMITAQEAVGQWYRIFNPSQQADYSFTTNGWFLFKRFYSYYGDPTENQMFFVKDYNFGDLLRNGPDFQLDPLSNKNIPYGHCKTRMFLAAETGPNQSLNIYIVNDGSESPTLIQTFSDLYNPRGNSIIYIPEKDIVLIHVTVHGNTFSYDVLESTNGGLSFARMNLTESNPLNSSAYAYVFYWKDRYFKNGNAGYSFDLINWISNSIGPISGNYYYLQYVNGGSYLYAFYFYDKILYASSSTDGVTWSNPVELSEQFYDVSNIYTSPGGIKNGKSILTVRYLFGYNASGIRVYEITLNGEFSKSNMVDITSKLQIRYDNKYVNAYGEIRAVTNTLI